jgi:hypothetical protein
MRRIIAPTGGILALECDALQRGAIWSKQSRGSRTVSAQIVATGADDKLDLIEGLGTTDSREENDGAQQKRKPYPGSGPEFGSAKYSGKQPIQKSDRMLIHNHLLDSRFMTQIVRA